MPDLPILLFTLRVAAVSTAVIAPIALLLAALASHHRRLRVPLDAIGALPLIVPPTAIGFILLEILSRRAPIGRLLTSAGIDVLFTPKAVIIACGVMSFPLMYTAFRVAIETSDLRYVQMARTLGVSPLGAFFRVTLPLAWRGLLSGIVLAYCRALGEFGATVLVAGNIPGRTQTLALAIYARVQSGRQAEATPLLVYVVVIAVASVVATELLVRRRQRRFAT
jgi:molybdate transport system permease protein